MLRWFLSIVVLLSATAPAAMGHFMFVVPQSDAGKARLVFSETLEPDESVNVYPVEARVAPPAVPIRISRRPTRRA